MVTVHDQEHELVLDAAEVATRMASEGVEEGRGVRRTVLWEQAGSTSGVLQFEPGARIGEHVHAGHAHHVWVVAGRARVMDRVLTATSYWFVPPGRPHTLEALKPDGCQLFYLYLARAADGS